MNLWQLIRAKRTVILPENSALLSRLRPDQTVTVNAQNVFAAAYHDAVYGAGWFRKLEEFPCITPPHERMRIEWRPQSEAVAMLVRRIRLAEGFELECALWGEYQGLAIHRTTFYFRLDEYGHSVSNNVHVAFDSRNGTAKDVDAFEICIACDALCRMHCEGWNLTPIREGKNHPAKPRKVAPATVWHRLEFGGSERLHQTTGSSMFRPDESQKREYTVRGHYADYRRGAGLFGRFKVLIWVPDHKRGNPELGQVIPEYVAVA